MATASQTVMKRRARPRWATLAGRAFLGLAVLLLVLGGAILALGAKAKADLKAKYSPPGQMVDVGGYRLHIACQGTGSPTVVMDSGLGDSSLLWGAVPAEVAASTRVCVYDRAGLGWSDPSPRPRLAPEVVDELHRLLQNAGVAGPYLLVGHSLGGIHARLYAHTYPGEVAGMVLVDSAHEEQLLRFPEATLAVNEQLQDDIQGQLRLARVLVSTGLLALNPSFYPVHARLSPEAAEAYRAVAVTDGSVVDAISAEMGSVAESMAQVRAARITTLGDIPLIVVSHGLAETPPPGLTIPAEALRQQEEVWQEMQVELATLSSNGKRIVAEQSGHYVQLDQPELVIAAIREVLEMSGSAQ